MISLRCKSGQDVYSCLDEAKKDGAAPKNAQVGGRDNGGKQPANAIGRITVRANESFWIVE